MIVAPDHALRSAAHVWCGHDDHTRPRAALGRAGLVFRSSKHQPTERPTGRPRAPRAGRHRPAPRAHEATPHRAGTSAVGDLRVCCTAQQNQKRGSGRPIAHAPPFASWRPHGGARTSWTASAAWSAPPGGASTTSWTASATPRAHELDGIRWYGALPCGSSGAHDRTWPSKRGLAGAPRAPRSQG